MNLEYKLDVLLKKRHWQAIFSNITARKLVNALKNLIYYKLNISSYKAYPVVLKVEITDFCNLKCSNCHDDSIFRKNLWFNYQEYKKIIDDVYKYVMEVVLYHQGEPLLDPRIIDFITYAKNKNVSVVISSNFSINLTEKKIEDLVLSGLDYLIVAIDGITQETYSRKRVGGRLSRVMFNLMRLLNTKRKLLSPTPFIEWQMIDLPFNRNEQIPAKKLAREIGVDNFIIKPAWDDTIFKKTLNPRKKRCPLPWINCTVLCDGNVSVCNNDFVIPAGNIHKSTISDIFGSENYNNIRKTHVKKEKYFCRKCHLYE